jgi:NADH-quinone oxidoreductase subunit L
MTAENLLLTAVIILLLPLLSFTINIFWGKRLGDKAAIVGASILGVDLILAVVTFVNKVFGAVETKSVLAGALQIISNDAMVQAKYTWVSVGSFALRIGVGVDNLACIMLIVVTLISFLVHIFSSVYMHGDKRFPRFYAYLGLFTFSMLGIVIANNFLNMYIFWELVGISSYLLIGFWYEKDSAANAGKKAFLTNRVGDLGFFIGIMMLFSVFGTLMYDELFPALASHSTLAGIASGKIALPFGLDYHTYLTLAGIFVFCGAIGKSAQFPLHVWLPDAMEGPTPVSALIHAATMVAAGVYLTARAFPMLTAEAMTFVAFVGAITAFIAATIAITQSDFKKVLAYSTVSQLGYMVMGLGVGAFTSGFFHLVTHAWFKAALFLGSGSVIHAMHESMHHMHDHHTDPQNLYNMGGLRKNMKLTYATFLFVTLAISGVPLTSGFLSKDSILAGTLAYADLAGGLNWLIPIAGFGAAGITAFYMFRLTILAFHGEHKTEVAKQTKENNFRIVMPLVVLSLLSLWIVYSPNPTDGGAGWFYEKVKMPVSAVPVEFQRPFMVEEKHEGASASHEAVAAHETSNNEHSVKNEVAKHEESHGAAHHARNLYEETMHHFHMPAMILSLLIAGAGILFSFMVYQFKIFNADNMEKYFKKLHTFSYNKWYFDELYDATVIAFVMFLSKLMSMFDSKVIDGIVNASAWITNKLSGFIGIFDNVVVDGVVNLVANSTGVLGGAARKLQTGKVQTYIAFALIALIALVYFCI